MPIVYFSAPSNKEKAFSACARDGFIEKPFDIDNFITTVSSYLNQPR
jgi:hypothetical protein